MATKENGSFLKIQQQKLLDLCSMDREELEEFFKELGEPSFRGRQLFRWLWKPFIYDFSQMSDLSLSSRDRLEKIAFLYRLAPKKVLRSIDGTVKIAWKLKDGNIIESVFIPEEKRKTICVSTQVGCGVGCKFCNTARMGFIRNLTVSEICLQILGFIEWLRKENPEGLPVRNIVFMGMGEPLLNYENLLKAISILTDDLGLNFSTRKITVSTCGIVPKIRQLGKDTNVKLAVSLHAPDNDTRSRLMPINKKYPLEQLIDVLKDYPVSPRKRITLEYLLIYGINDSETHARLLAKLLRNIKCKINLIPYNEIGEKDKFKAPREEDILRFQKVLIEEHYTATVRKSRGRDIDAACGQLFVALSSHKKS